MGHPSGSVHHSDDVADFEALRNFDGLRSLALKAAGTDDARLRALAPALLGAKRVAALGFRENRISGTRPLGGLERLWRSEGALRLDGNPLSEGSVSGHLPEVVPSCNGFQLGAVSWLPAAGAQGIAEFRAGGFFAAKFGGLAAEDVPALIAFSASADRAALRPSVSAGGVASIRQARLAGPAIPSLSRRCAQPLPQQPRWTPRHARA